MSTRQCSYLMRIIGTIAVVMAAGCASGRAAPAEDQTVTRSDSSAVRVLFIGNSYLYFRDIPGIVEALSDSAGGTRIAAAMLARPDFALVDHWMGRSARREIERERYDIVVLQQGPSSTEVNRDSLRLMTRLFSQLIRNAGGRPALFSAWPSESRWFDFERAIASYRLAADDVAGLYLPVAPAWLEVRERRRNTPLYSDGLHPTITGAYLSALVVYARILGKSPVGLPSRLRTPRGTIVTVEDDLARLLQEVAAEMTASVRP